MAMFACGLWLLAAMPVDVAHWDMVWRMLLAGSGFALYQSPNNHTIVTSAPMSRSGAAGGNAEALALAIAGGFAALAGLFSMMRVSKAAVAKH